MDTKTIDVDDGLVPYLYNAVGSLDNDVKPGALTQDEIYYKAGMLAVIKMIEQIVQDDGEVVSWVQ